MRKSKELKSLGSLILGQIKGNEEENKIEILNLCSALDHRMDDEGSSAYLRLRVCHRCLDPR